MTARIPVLSFRGRLRDEETAEPPAQEVNSTAAVMQIGAVSSPHPSDVAERLVLMVGLIGGLWSEEVLSNGEVHHGCV